jgi:hypothetical protein
MTKPCLCMLCPYCRTSASVDSLWIRRRGRTPRFLGRVWFAEQFCRTCGSHWASWHWLEQHTGLLWRRFFAVNPGRHTPEQVAELVRLKSRYERHRAEVM